MEILPRKVETPSLGVTGSDQPIDDRRQLVSVAVALPVEGLYRYELPDHLASQARPGKRVLVPFGHRTVTGYLLGPGKAERAVDIKQVVAVLDEVPLFPEKMIPFFQWIAAYYLHPVGQVINTALPAGLTLSDTAVLSLTEEGRKALNESAMRPLEASILSVLAEHPAALKKLERETGRSISPSVIRKLQQRLWLRVDRQLNALPVRTKRIRMVAASASFSSFQNLSPQRRAILEQLASEGRMSVAALKKRVPTAPSLVRAMQKDGQVSIYEKRVQRDPLGGPIESDRPPVLTGEQQLAVDRLALLLENGYKTVLLAGITGSGKTEVYLRLAAMTLDKGLSVLVMVPEIALISQTERRFRARFGEMVAVLHSALSRGERYDQWLRIAEGRAGIAVGARSCVFAPFRRLGLIIVDEEHDLSYKQEGGLHYNARDLAIVRARQEGVLAVLGSATPSLQSWHNVSIGKFETIMLSKRINRQPLPKIETVDLSKRRDVSGTGRYLSQRLQDAIRKTLEAGNQVLLFLNRRGFSAFPTCGRCGQPIRCKNCDITLTLHRQANAYRCHYCGFSKPAVSTCAACNSDRIKLLGVGTEKVQTVVQKLFPTARVARMDRDTVTRKGSIVKLLRDLKTRRIDILVGTQMIAKGHDFPGITLVGVICADLTLNFPDFRAGERTFQLLAQVAGRAGRGELPGTVILQTYNPEHFAIRSAKEQDFEAFFSEEIRFREALGYPPMTRMIAIRISAKDRQQASDTAAAMGGVCDRLLTANGEYDRYVHVMGPVEAPLPRIAKRHRWQLLVKSPNTHLLHKFVKDLRSSRHAKAARRSVTVSVDVDPYFLM